MQLTYDPACNIAYIRLRRKVAKVTTVVVSDELNVDIGPDGRVYGIELLNANNHTTPEAPGGGEPRFRQEGRVGLGGVSIQPVPSS